MIVNYRRNVSISYHRSQHLIASSIWTPLKTKLAQYAMLVWGHLQQTPLTWTNRKAQNSMGKILELPYEQKGCTDKNGELQAESSAVGDGSLTTRQYEEVQQSLLVKTGCATCHTAVLCKIQLRLEYLSWSVCTEMSTPELKGWFSCLHRDFSCCLRCYRKSETPTRRWQMQHRTSQYSTSRPEIASWSIQFGTQQLGHVQGYLASQYSQGILGNNLVCQELHS